MASKGQRLRPGIICSRSPTPECYGWTSRSSEQDAVAVRVGAPATITVDALPDGQFRGRVTFIYPQLDEKTRTADARVAVKRRRRHAPGNVPTAGSRRRAGGA